MSNTETAAVGYYTAVFRVEGDRARHNEWWQSIRPLFMADDHPISIVSISKGDLAAKVDELEEKLGSVTNAE